MAINEYATDLASERIKRRWGLVNLIDILTTEDRYDDALVLASISTSGLCQSHCSVSFLHRKCQHCVRANFIQLLLPICSILLKEAARLMARNPR